MPATPAPSPLVRALPNTLTGLRLLIAAAFPALPHEWRLWAIVTGGLSDGIDGFIARRYGAQTRWGAVLDALADKAFTLSVLLTLTFDGPIRGWELALLLSRDIIVAGLAAFIAATRGWASWKQVRPRALGKAATAAVIVVMVVAVAAPGWVAWAAVPAGCLSLLAGLDYARVEWLGAREPVEST